MKKYFSFFLLTILISCSSMEDSVTIPDSVLSEEKMAEVMVDVHLLEATLNINTFSKDNIAMNPINPSSDILKKNNVTKQQFDESFVFYTKNPLLMSQVYQLVLNNLSKMQAEVMNKK